MADGTAGDRACRVLVVEDSKINRLVVLQMLKRASVAGAPVVADEAESARQALKMLGEETYNLVLMDVQMPEMDGMAATRAIRDGETGDVNRNVPVIAMTAYADPEDEQACYEAGMTGYLAKPIRMDSFVATVQAVLEESVLED